MRKKTVATLAKTWTRSPRTFVRLACSDEGGQRMEVGTEPWTGPAILRVGDALIVERTEHEVIVTIRRGEDTP